MKKELELKPENGIYNENDKTMSAADCETALEAMITPELVFSFVADHYNNDLGNDTPPSGAELEESFRNMLHRMGFRGPKVEGFVKRAMTSIDDYDYTDKFDNINQSRKSHIGNKIFGGDIDLPELPELNKSPRLGDMDDSPTERKNAAKNNPFYINPNPFDNPTLTRK